MCKIIPKGRDLSNGSEPLTVNSEQFWVTLRGGQSGIRRLST